MTSRRPLLSSFFCRPVLTVAPEILGKFLVRTTGEDTVAAMITDVEAYRGTSDLACHASKGQTDRNRILWEAGGRWYVYLVYGLHFMLNVVTGEPDDPSAILIRGVAGVNGPGRVTKYFRVTKEDNNTPARISSGLYIEDRGVLIPSRAIRKGPRIGIDYAGPVWSQKPWRFSLPEQ